MSRTSVKATPETVGLAIATLQSRLAQSSDAGEIVRLEENLSMLKRQYRAISGGQGVPSGAPSPAQQTRPAVAQGQAIDLNRIEVVTATQAEAFLAFTEKIPHDSIVAQKIDAAYKQLAEAGVPADVLMNITEYAKASDSSPGLYVLELGGKGFEALTEADRDQLLSMIPQGFLIEREAQEDAPPPPPPEEEKPTSGPGQVPGPGVIEGPPNEEDLEEEVPEEEKEDVPSLDDKVDDLMEEVQEIHEEISEFGEVMVDLVDQELHDEKEDDDELTPEEFGLDDPFGTIYGEPDKAVPARRSNMATRDLRAERIQRARSRKAPSRPTDRVPHGRRADLTEEWKPDSKKTYKTFKSTPSGVPVKDNEMKQKSKKDLDSLPSIYRAKNEKLTREALKALNVELKPAKPTAGKKQSWFVQMEDTPVYRIDPLVKGGSTKFASKAFGSSILAAIQNHGLVAAMRLYRAARVAPKNPKTTATTLRRSPLSRRGGTPRPRRAMPPMKDGPGKAGPEEDGKGKSMPKGKPPMKGKPKGKPPMGTDKEEACKPGAVDRKPMATTQAQIQEAALSMFRDDAMRFRRALALAIKASNRNIIRPHPLKHALYQSLDALGVADANVIIDEAFDNAGEDHFAVLLQTADKYMDMAPEALVDLEARIAEMPVYQVPNRGQAGSQGVQASDLRQRAVQGSAPIMTNTVQDPGQSRRDQIRSVVPQPNFSRVAQSLLNRG